METLFDEANENVRIVGKLSDDKIKLFVDVEPLAQPVTKQHLLSILLKSVPTDRLDHRVIDDIVKHLLKGEKVEDRRVARGKEPVRGADGKVLYLVKRFTGDAHVAVDERGYAKFNQLELFDNIRKDQLVARIYKPKPGIDGEEALGTPIKAAPGNPASQTLDNESVLLQAPENSDEGYDIVIAKVDGYLVEESGTISIKTELVIRSDLDYRFGTINFVGSVKVMGDVMPGFDITAEKGIEISGTVQGGSLVCKGGDILVKGFVFGGEKSRIIAGKSFTATVVQEVNADIAGNIIIKKEARSSHLRAQGMISLPQGQILGGDSYPVCGLEAKLIGAEAGMTTTIHLCSDVESSTEYGTLLIEIENHQKAVDLIKLHLGPLAGNPSRVARLNSPHREKMTALLAKLAAVEKSRTGLLTRQKEMLAGARRNKVYRLNVIGSMYPGVVVTADQERFENHEVVSGPKSLEFNPEKKVFEFGDLKALECDLTDIPKGEGDGEAKQ